MTKENFEKVKKDMPKKEVEDLLGKGEVKAAIKIGETTGDGVVYTGEKGKGEVIFKDDKVVVTCEFCSSVYDFTPDEAGVEDA